MLIRYYAAAAEAAGCEEESLPMAAGATVKDLDDALIAAHPALASVRPQCSLLVDGATVTDTGFVVGDASTIDVLPPFAGG